MVVSYKNLDRSEFSRVESCDRGFCILRGDTIAEIVGLATAHNIELRLARVKGSIQELLERDGVLERLGEDHIYGNVYEAVADQIPDGVNQASDSK